MKNALGNNGADKKNTGPAGNEDLPENLLYPPGEDILNPANNSQRVDIDLDNVSRPANSSSPKIKQTAPDESAFEEAIGDEEQGEAEITRGNDADVTEEELLLLGQEDRDMDMGEDEELQNKGFPIGLTGIDLDVPGEELDDADEEIGEEDEENNYYSLGGDSKDGLEENGS